MRFWRALIVLIALYATVAQGAVFQYTAPVATSKSERSAYLWIPPRAEQIRGVILCGMTLMEREFVQDNRIRQACRDQQLALIFLNCGLGAVDVQAVLDDLAERSGYAELSVAPLMFVGHSAGGPQAKACAMAMRERCFGLVQYRGGVPGGEPAVPPGIPTLMMLGQFDEFGGTMRDASGRETWQGGRDALAEFRAGDPGRLASLAVEPGAGHFAWSDRNADYLAMFVHKAAGACIPERWPRDSQTPIHVRSIDAPSGWLSDLAIRGEDCTPAAAFEDYQGDRQYTSWHFDRELAEATVAYHGQEWNKQDQFLRWNDPHWVDAGARFFFTKVNWIGDGQTFELHPEYADRYPGQHNGQGPRWLQAGQTVGHSDAPIRVKHVSGPVVATGPQTLRVQYSALAPAREKSRVTLMAFSPGNNIYRYTEQVGMLPRGFGGFTKGAEQTIEFLPPADLRANDGPVPLKATSDSGLPVEFYVARGPARVIGERLEIVELPRRAKFPIVIEVVAWQFGRGIDPLVRTAAPVSRELVVRQP